MYINRIILHGYIRLRMVVPLFPRTRFVLSPYYSMCSLVSLLPFGICRHTILAPLETFIYCIILQFHTCMFYL